VSEQLALFDKVRAEPEGLRYAADFVSPENRKETCSMYPDRSASAFSIRPV
jgi:hypothetical protein